MTAPHPPLTAANAVLQAIADGQIYSVGYLSGLLGLTGRQVTLAATLLMRRGYAKRMSVGRYRLTEEGAAAAAMDVKLVARPDEAPGGGRKHRDTFRERAWRSMRIHRRFTMNDIIADADRNDGAGRKNAETFVQALRKAGYVRALSGRAPGRGGMRFELVRNTGPLAPVHRKGKRLIHDFNTGEDVPCAT